MVEFQHQFHSALPPTTVWGYQDIGGGQPAKYLGPVIIATKDTPTAITFSSTLPDMHVLMRDDPNDPQRARARTGIGVTKADTVVDTTVMGAEATQAHNRTVPHLHGGFTPWQADGGPYGWWTPGAPDVRPIVTGFGPELERPLRPGFRPKTVCLSEQHVRAAGVVSRSRSWQHAIECVRRNSRCLCDHRQY